jgi:sodium/potassium-transporting ATPase subunit alpha
MSSLITVASYRKPLGDPPQAANLALAVVLLIVILIQALFNAWQDFSTSRVMASIKGMLPSDVLVLRDGGQTKISAKELVPGDLVTITMGEKVPADLKLIEVSADLQFDRSILTGEACFPFHHRSLPSINFSIIYQSEPVYGRVAMTDENFLEVGN